MIPTIRVAVDPANPGQFFACCGLLELADRLWPGAEGWFEDGTFCVACGGTLPDVLGALTARLPEKVIRLENGLDVDEPIAPLRLALVGSEEVTLTLDSWTTIRIEKGKPTVASNPPWKFWGGHQKSHGIWTGLRDALVDQLRKLDPGSLPGLFTQRLPFKGQFGFDAGPAWQPLDVGFSPNEQNMKVASSPAVELLAAVGVQRFRPRVTDRTTVMYATWGQPLTTAISAACAIGVIPAEPVRRYRCRVMDRGQGYAALSYSTPLQGDDDA